MYYNASFFGNVNMPRNNRAQDSCDYCGQIQASNGASDYGNKFGEPVIHGFTRSFGQRLPGGERYE